jgi:hypothetical protein
LILLLKETHTWGGGVKLFQRKMINKCFANSVQVQK